jgi:iron(III) transport system substrate-binding protein
MRPLRSIVPAMLSLMIAPFVLPATAAEVNVYSSRHYDTDERLYSNFTDATGIEVNRIEGTADELIARLKAEGANSPADILMTVDAGRVWLADREGLFQPVSSEILNDAIPAHLRHPDGNWFGLSQRARIIFFSKERVASSPQTYAELADPKWKGRVCIRSSSNIYNLSLMGSIIAHEGSDAASTWAQGVLDNLARPPEGGDTDQLRGIVSGICDVAVANTYYFARAMDQDIKGLSDPVDQIGWVFPNQDSTGTHVNIAAAGVVANAPHKEEAVAFLEYLISPRAQEFLASQNYEYPVVEGVAAGEVAASLGSFKSDTLNLKFLGENQPEAQRIFNEAGFP